MIFGSPEKSVKSSILKLGRELKARGMVSYMETITGARVPIIKMTHAETGTDADICFNQEGGVHMGQMIKHMISVIPAMKPLVLVLKYFLHQRELNVTFKGGVGASAAAHGHRVHSASCESAAAYAVRTTDEDTRKGIRARYNHAMNGGLKNAGKLKAGQRKKKAMAVANKKADAAVAAEKRAFRKRGNGADLGTMLLEFLEFYGRALDTRNIGISVRGQGSLYRKIDRGFVDGRSGRAELLSMENPESPSVDIGANSAAVLPVL